MTVICDSSISEKEKNRIVEEMIQRHKGSLIDGITIKILDEEWLGVKLTFAPVSFDRIRRITGYLVGDTSRWNNGKKAELNDRIKHGMEA